MGKWNAYPQEVIDFVAKTAPGTRIRVLAEITNEKFGTNFTHTKMSCFLKNHGIKNGMPPSIKGERAFCLFSKEISEFILSNYIGTGPTAMTDVVNKKFGTEYSITQMKGFYLRNKLRSGITGYFEKGYEPHNKGRKGVCSPGCEKTWFKKGNLPKNAQPVGSIIVDKEGYSWIKVAQPREWKVLHRVIWEEAHGPIPEGHMIIFLDQDKGNFELSNLAMISRKEHVFMIKNGLRKEVPELMETGVLIARLEVIQKNRIKEAKNENQKN